MLSLISDCIQLSAQPVTVWYQERYLAALSLHFPLQDRSTGSQPPPTLTPDLSAWMRCDDTCQVVFGKQETHVVYLPLSASYVRYFSKLLANIDPFNLQDNPMQLMLLFSLLFR